MFPRDARKARTDGRRADSKTVIAPAAGGDRQLLPTLLKPSMSGTPNRKSLNMTSPTPSTDTATMFGSSAPPLTMTLGTIYESHIGSNVALRVRWIRGYEDPGGCGLALPVSAMEMEGQGPAASPLFAGQDKTRRPRLALLHGEALALTTSTDA
ncbi:MAG: hypothetical protein F4Y60_00605 [Boseongicola sp. SB0664_bin_43]|uniref:Uncharacterized protein n=1 Tax=Boseongicola sp. SB0664_bin_43 TaxID=2604844 RepID=A0A6B0XVA5_9RHOB|nr:hypothetical protein [Boseongicola sp. SB0664_bin_43]